MRSCAVKSDLVAYACWFFGFHRFYLGRPFTGLLYLLTVGGLGFWALLDLLLIPGMVRSENREFARMTRPTVVVNVGKRRRA